MQKRGKKGTALVLTLAMLASLLPTGAFAETYKEQMQRERRQSTTPIGS